METYIKKAEDLEAVNTNFIPPLLDAILGDYNSNVPAARDAEVLNVMATITSRLGVRYSAFTYILFIDISCLFIQFPPCDSLWTLSSLVIPRQIIAPSLSLIFVPLFR